MTFMPEKMLSATEGEKRSLEQLERGLDNIRAAPSATGHVALIVCRPGIEQRQVIETGELTLEQGLLGDNWKVKPCSSAPAGAGHPDMQLTLMNVRVIDTVTTRETCPLLATSSMWILI